MADCWHSPCHTSPPISPIFPCPESNPFYPCRSANDRIPLPRPVKVDADGGDYKLIPSRSRPQSPIVPFIDVSSVSEFNSAVVMPPESNSESGSCGAAMHPRVHPISIQAEAAAMVAPSSTAPCEEPTSSITKVTTKGCETFEESTAGESIVNRAPNQPVEEFHPVSSSTVESSVESTSAAARSPPLVSPITESPSGDEATPSQTTVSVLQTTDRPGLIVNLPPPSKEHVCSITGSSRQQAGDKDMSKVPLVGVIDTAINQQELSMSSKSECRSTVSDAFTPESHRAADGRQGGAAVSPQVTQGTKGCETFEESAAPPRERTTEMEIPLCAISPQQDEPLDNGFLSEDVGLSGNIPSPSTEHACSIERFKSAPIGTQVQGNSFSFPLPLTTTGKGIPVFGNDAQRLDSKGWPHSRPDGQEDNNRGSTLSARATTFVPREPTKLIQKPMDPGSPRSSPWISTVIIGDQTHVLLLRRVRPDGHTTMVLPSHAGGVSAAHTAWDTMREILGDLPSESEGASALWKRGGREARPVLYSYDHITTIEYETTAHAVVSSQATLLSSRDLIANAMSERSPIIQQVYPEVILVPWPQATGSWHTLNTHMDASVQWALNQARPLLEGSNPSPSPLMVCSVVTATPHQPEKVNSRRPAAHGCEKHHVGHCPALQGTNPDDAPLAWPPPSKYSSETKQRIAAGLLKDRRPAPSLHFKKVFAAWRGLTSSEDTLQPGARVLLAVIRPTGEPHLLMMTREGAMQIPSVEIAPCEPEAAAVRRIGETLLARPGLMQRALQDVRPHYSTLRVPLRQQACCYAVMDGNVLVPAFSDAWKWVPLAIAMSVCMRPCDREALRRALNAMRPRLRRTRMYRTMPTHILNTPVQVEKAMGMIFERPLTASRSAPPCYVALVSPSAAVQLTSDFIAAATTESGSVKFDQKLLERLIDMSKDRALARGSLRVTPRDASEAAQVIAEARRSPLAPSPAAQLPSHFDQLKRDLQAVCEDVNRIKLGGSRAPKVLIVGEIEGVAATMFDMAGADVATCDFGDRRGGPAHIPHFKGDAMYIQDLGWDFVLVHPPCTYLSNAGVQYLHKEEGRMSRMLEAVDVFERLRAARAPHICVEQPKMHGYATRALGGLKATQYVHPHQHGTGHTKATGLHLSPSLPPLRPTCEVPGRIHALALLSPGPHRGALRSRTYIGIAGAMALQWMPVLINYVVASSSTSPPESALDLVGRAESAGRIGQVETTVAPIERIDYSLMEDVVPPPAPDNSEASPENQLQWPPWLNDRSKPRIPHLPITQMRRRHGRWRALRGVVDGPVTDCKDKEAQGAPTSYRWVPVALPDHERIDAILRGDSGAPEVDGASVVAAVSRERKAPRYTADPLAHRFSKTPPTPFSYDDSRFMRRAVISSDNDKWKQSSEALERWNQSQNKIRIQGVLDAEEIALRQPPRHDHKAEPRPRPGGIRVTPGVRAEGEELGPSRIAQHEGNAKANARGLRAEYARRFIPASAPVAPILVAPVIPSVPVAPVMELAPENEELGSFADEDVAIPPPPLDFPTHCAYVTDFAVARKLPGTADDHKGTRYLVGNAACTIGPALSDTGAGPSIIGSGLLDAIPRDACVGHQRGSCRVDPGLAGPDGKPLLTRGTVTLVFTMDGFAFRHDFTVVEGGNLLLLGNDFLARYHAEVTPSETPYGDGRLILSVQSARQSKRRISIRLSCAPRHNRPVAAVVPKVPARPSRPCASVTTTEETSANVSSFPAAEVVGIEAAHPWLIDIGGDKDDDGDGERPPLPAVEHVASQIVTDEFLLYCEKAVKIPGRRHTVIYLRVPKAHQHSVVPLLVDRLGPRHDLDQDVMVACSLATPDAEGLVAVSILNASHKTKHIPAFSPVARILVEFEILVADAIDINSDEPYKRLSAAQRRLIDDVQVDRRQDGEPANLLSEDQRRRVRDLLARRIKAFAIDPKDPTHTHLMEVELPLKEGAVPHRHAASRLGEAGCAIVDKMCAEMEANGIIRKSNSAWGSRVVLVKKSNGETRFCIDFRQTNSKLVTLDSPIPRCDEAIDRLASGAGPQDSLFLSTIDLASGFWTLPIKESDKGVTAFVTHRQKYEWNYLPFGVQSGPSYMCRLMDAALSGLAWDCCMPYLDDVGIHSTGVGSTPEARELASFEQMLHRVDLVLERLIWAGLSAKASKCRLFSTQADFLGHVISRRGLEMDPKKVSKIKDIDPTSINTIGRVRSFVGLCSYYRRFVKGFAKIVAPLTDLTKDGVDVAVESQTIPCQEAIKHLIDCMTSEPVVMHMPRYDRPFIVKTDAAATEGIGGLLVQLDDDDRERVVAYYGRRLTPAERKYTVSEIELLAALESIRNWRPYLWGRKFTLVTDHAALKWLHTMKDMVEGGPASRLMRWNLKLLEYNFEVVHKPGKDHGDADGVSRLVAVVQRTMVRVPPDPRTGALAPGLYPLPPTHAALPTVVHASKLALYDPKTWKVYCWERTRGGLDLPGGHQDPTDKSSGHALLRECHEEIILPLPLRSRLEERIVSGEAPRVCKCPHPTRPNETHHVSVWFVAASLAELQAIEQTPEGLQEGQAAGLRPLAELIEVSPYSEALMWLGVPDRAPVPTASVNHAPAGKVKDLQDELQECRQAYAAWVETQELDNRRVTAATLHAMRTRMTDSVFGTPSKPMSSDTPAIAEYNRLMSLPSIDEARIVGTTQTPGLRGKQPRRAMVTARRLQTKDRVQRNQGQTREKVIEHYVRVGTPSEEALKTAQGEDPTCMAFRMFQVTGDTGAIMNREDLNRAAWVARESKHLVVLENGVISRVDPAPSDQASETRPTPVAHPRPFIPQALRVMYLEAFHDHLGHQGRQKTLMLLRSRVYWPGMQQSVDQHVRDCHECTVAKRASRQSADPTRPTVGSYPFDSVICDLTDMKLTHDGKYDKMMVFADSLSRWIEAIPCLGDPTAEQVLDAYATHVACRYGWPRELRSDGGSNLANKLSAAIHRSSGVELLKGAAYHSQSQGVAERVQGTLAQMCKTVDEGGEFWADHLPFLMFTYHATPHRVTGLSPAMVIYGRELRLPAQIGGPDGAQPIPDLPAEVEVYARRLQVLLHAAWSTARDATSGAQEISYSQAWSKCQARVFAKNDTVCYHLEDKSNKLFADWVGPHRIQAVLGNGNYRLRDLANKKLSDVFHVSRLRPYTTVVNAEDLQEDEYVIDELISHKGDQLRDRSYRCKWRGYSRDKAGELVLRAELMRRCSELVVAYDALHPPRPTAPKRVNLPEVLTTRPTVPPRPPPRDRHPSSRPMPLPASAQSPDDVSVVPEESNRVGSPRQEPCDRPTKSRPRLFVPAPVPDGEDTAVVPPKKSRPTVAPRTAPARNAEDTILAKSRPTVAPRSAPRGSPPMPRPASVPVEPMESPMGNDLGQVTPMDSNMRRSPRLRPCDSGSSPAALPESASVPQKVSHHLDADRVVAVEEDVPYRAMLDRGKWRYVRHHRTHGNRVKDRFFEPTAFTPDELSSAVFSSLRTTYLASLVATVAAAVCRRD